MDKRIKELAVQAGMEVDLVTGGFDVWFSDGYYIDVIERFAELVRQNLYQVIGKSVIEQINSAVQMEREACAKLCEEVGNKAKDNDGYTMGGYACAKAIRARGKA